MSAWILFNRALLKPNISSQLLRHNIGRMSTAAKVPTVPRLSASLLLVNPRNEILLVHRPTHSSTFPNAHVFPGGATSPGDNESTSPLKLCAIRETFEETGLLLTNPPPPPSILEGIQEVRSQIHAGKLSFTEYLKSNGLKPALDDLIPFTKWITPKEMPRRFEAQMFLYFLPEENSSASAAGKGSEQLPTGDGGVEILSTKFMTPHAALEAARKDEIVFFPPQFYLISKLLPYLEEAGLEDHVAKLRRKRLIKLAQGEFGKMIIEPAPIKRLSDGRVIMGLGPDGDQENVVVIQLAKKGEPRGLELVKRSEMAKL